MARFKSVVTNIGAEKLAAILAGGGRLTLIRAAVGSGRTDADRAALPGLIQPETADVQVGEMEVAASGGRTVLRLPVQVSNKGLTKPLPVREVAIYGKDDGGGFLFAISWLDGADTDNIIPVSGAPDEADTMHIQDVGVILTNQEAAAIQVEIGVGSTVTEGRLAREIGRLRAEMENLGGGLVLIPPGEEIPVEERKPGYLYFRELAE